MEFSSEDTRDEYFRRIEADWTTVEYGAALRHAGTTQLGFFGGQDAEEALFNDCSRIMLAEVIKFSTRPGWCRICDIHLSMTWHMLYESSRAKPRKELAATYRELGEANDNEALMEEAARLKTYVALSETPPYQMVYDDIKRKGLIP